MKVADIKENSVDTVIETAVVSPKNKVGRPKTKMTLKRVVLSDGQPVGRGRPSLDGKGERTVVFIPVNETYDASKHGTGKKYIAGFNQYKTPIKRVDLKTWNKMVGSTE